MKNSVIRNENFRKVATNVKPDAKKRIIISKALTEGVTYHIYCNEIGQIILDPQVSIPAAEVWLFKNQKARDAVAIGLKEAAEGKATKIPPKSVKKMRGFLKGIDTTVKREPDRVDVFEEGADEPLLSYDEMVKRLRKDGRI